MEREHRACAISRRDVDDIVAADDDHLALRERLVGRADLRDLFRLLENEVEVRVIVAVERATILTAAAQVDDHALVEARVEDVQRQVLRRHAAGASERYLVVSSVRHRLARTHANLTVVGKDRTGVVARVTSFLFEERANIEALEERVRRGQFHMMLEASFPAGFDEASVRRGLAAIARELSMEVRLRVHAPGARRRAAILVTKEPHCLDAVISAVRAGRLAMEPVLVLSNRNDLAPLAKRHGLPFQHVPWTSGERAEAKALKLLDKADVDLLVLARFMRILSPAFVWRFPNRIVNVHPSLLPAFPGASASRQAWERGVRVAVATAHFVTPELDAGPILAQKAFPLRRDDTVDELKWRGQEAEAEILV